MKYIIKSTPSQYLIKNRCSTPERVQELACPLSFISGKSQDESYILIQFKQVIITPIFKGRDNPCLATTHRSHWHNYVVTKVFERLIKKQLMYYMEATNLYNSCQLGFRKGQSCHVWVRLTICLHTFLNIHLLKSTWSTRTF